MNPTMDQVQPTAAPAKMLWGAVAVLGVAVVAMGATMLNMQGQNAPREPVAQLALALKSEKAAPEVIEVATPAATANTQVPPTIVINNHMTPEKTRPVARTVAAAPARQAPVQISPAPVPAAQVITSPYPAPVPQVTGQQPSQQVPNVASGATIYSGYPAQTPTYPSNSPQAVYPQPVYQPPVAQTQPRSSCFNCGTVESVSAVQRSASTGGTGAVAGGVLGAVVGNSIGKGSGRTLGTIIGAVGGGFAGNAIEKQMKKETVYQVRVRMDDGSLRTIEQTSAPSVGSRITLDGSETRAPQAGTGGTIRYGEPAGPIQVGSERS